MASALSILGAVLSGLAAIAAAGDPSGQDLPTASFGPWKLVFTENFLTDAPLGNFTKVYGSRWSARGSDWDADPRNPSIRPVVDTWRRGIYSPARTLSVSGGILDIWPHKGEGPQFGDDGKLIFTQDDCKEKPDCPLDKWADLAGKPWQQERPYVAAITPLVLNDASGAINPAAADGYKTAWMLWPRDGHKHWPRDGEIDYPEGNLTDNRYSAFHHYICNNVGSTAGQSSGTPTECEKMRQHEISHQDAFSPIAGAKYSEWHTATIEWLPNRINFLLDGNIAKTQSGTLANSTYRVPGSDPHPDPTVPAADLVMQWILQTETELNYNYIPATNEAHIRVDWVAVWQYQS